MNNSSKDLKKSSKTTPLEKTPTEGSKNSSAKTVSKTSKSASAVVAEKSEEKAEKKSEKKTESQSASAKESNAQIEQQKPSEKKTESQSTSAKESNAQTKQQDPSEKKTETSIKLNSLFGFKIGMTNVYEKNQMVPVTVIQYKTARVTQIKTKEKDGYTAVQTAVESSKKTNKAMKNHLKQAGFKNKAVYIKESRGPLPEGVRTGQKVSIESLQKGDTVFVSGISKGHGFSGVVKRWGFKGGPAAHGAEKHRTTGSIANTATQGRVFPGKKMPGHFGCDRITQKSRVVDVMSSQGAILVQGPVPGAKNSLIEIKKQEALK